MKRKDIDDNISTLTERVEAEGINLKDKLAQDKFGREHAPVTSVVKHSEKDQGARSEFEITIEAMVLKILNRHMAKVREDITRSILAEVRSRVHGSDLSGQ